MLEAGEMAQLVRTLAAFLEDSVMIPSNITLTKKMYYSNSKSTIPSSVSWGHQSCMCYIDMHSGIKYVHIKKIK